VDALDNIRAGQDKHFRTVFLAQIVLLQIQVDLVDGGPHRAVKNEDAVLKFLYEAAGHIEYSLTRLDSEHGPGMIHPFIRMNR
jgi:hypothetical protein